MDAARYRRLNEVFRAAIELEGSARADFLREACEGDSTLRSEVDDLLAEHEPGEELLTRPGPGRALRRHVGESVASELAGVDREMPAWIDDYRVLRCLGEGGMGVVYEAEQKAPRRRVAVKLLRPSLNVPSVLARFRREAEILARLRHPGIARVHESGRARPWGAEGPELPYLVMELVEGEPITAHAARRHLDVGTRLDLLARTCDAVQHAHERGIVHRDLKPANVLVDREGQPRVLDFGVARACDPELTRHTATSQFVGTLAYMSPEQFEDGGGAVGPPSDVHALGVLGFELLSGRQPHPVAGLALDAAARRIREVDPPLLGSLDPALAGDVSAIVARALEKEPARRYASAAEMADDLRRHLAHEPILARPPSTADRLRKFVRRNRSLSLAVGALIGTLLAAVTVSTWFAVREAIARRASEQAVEELRRSTYRAELAAALEALHSGNARKAKRHLEQAPEGLREWTWQHAAARLDDSLERFDLGMDDVLVSVAGPEGRLVFSDLRSLVVVETHGGLRVSRRIEGEQPKPSRDGRLAVVVRDGRLVLEDLIGDASPRDLGPGADPVALHDGRWVFRDGESVRLSSADGREQREVTRVDFPLLSRNTVLSADGHRLFVGTGEDLEMIDLASGRRHRWERPLRVVLETPDRRHLLLADDDLVVRVRAEDLEPDPWPREVRVGGEANPPVLEIDPSGERLLSISRSGEVVLWDLETGERLAEVAHVAYQAIAAWYSPDGGLVVIPDTSGWLRAYDARTGRQVHEPLIGHLEVPRGVLWLDDGARIASVDAAGRLRTFLAPGGHDPHVLTAHSSYVYDLDWSADGSVLASVAWDRSARTWDAAGGRPLALYEGNHFTGYAVAFDDVSGELIATHEHAVGRWDADGGELRSSSEHGRPVLDLEFDDAGRRLAIGALGRCWVAEGRDETDELFHLDGERGGACHADMAADGRSAAFAHRSRLRLLSVPEGRLLWEWEGFPLPARCVVLDPGGRLVAVAAGPDVYLFEAETGRLLRVLSGPDTLVYAIALHPDGHMLASGSQDGAVRTWDLDRGELIAELPGHRDYVYTLAFSPDGSALATGSGDATIRLWHVRPLGERLAQRERRVEP